METSEALHWTRQQQQKIDMDPEQQFYTPKIENIAVIEINLTYKPSNINDVTKIRNIGIIAHIDAGKTTTTERMLYYSGSSEVLGEVHHGDTVTDYMAQERERGITITSAAVTFNWAKHKINLIDTPGHVDFTFEVERALRVLDGAVTIIDASAGVEAQTITVWKQAQKYEIPSIVYLNKMDKPATNIDLCLNSIECKLDIRPLPIHFPIGNGKDFRELIDLVSLQNLSWPTEYQDGRVIQCKPFQADDYKEIWDEIMIARSQLIDNIIDLDEKAFEKAYENETNDCLTSQDLYNALRRITLNRKGLPLLMGSSYHNKGVQPLMDSILRYLPHPKQISHDFIKYYEPELCALVFKNIHDKTHGPLAFVRVYSGKLKQDEKLYNVNNEAVEKAPVLLAPFANEFTPVSEVGEGNIAVIGGLKEVKTGDTLTTSSAVAQKAGKQYAKEHNTSDHKPVLAGIDIPKPVFFCTIEPPSPAYEKPLDKALMILQNEDPTLKVRYDESLGQSVIYGMGELHIDVIKKRILEEFKIEVYLGPLQVSYKEMVGSRAEHEYVLNKVVGGSRNYVKIRLRVEPTEHQDEKLRVKVVVTKENNLGKLYQDRQKSVEEGVKAGLNSGPLLGFPVTGADVSLHWLEVGKGTSQAMLRAAAMACLKECLVQGGSTLLEPMMQLNITTPVQYASRVMSDLAQRRSQIGHIEAHGDQRVISAYTPLAELINYSSTLRTMTSGNVSLSMELHSYSPLDPNQTKKAIERTGSTTQWQADSAPKEMAASDMRNRRHVMEHKCCSSCIPGLGALTGYYQPGQLNPGFITGSTTQWQADLAPNEMATSDMRNRRNVQLLLTWSTNAAHPVSLEPLQVTRGTGHDNHGGYKKATAFTVSATPPLSVPSPDEKGGGEAVTSSVKNLGSADSADSTLNLSYKPSNINDVTKIRNIGIIAHIDAGKTTTTERMLYYSGSSEVLGEVHHGDTVTDYMAQERERGITITSAAVTFNWAKHKINLIDTPGHVDFTFEVERALRVLDGAVTIIDASAGVEAQTITVWKQAQKYEIPSIVYLNKMDKPATNIDLCLNSIECKLDIRPLPIHFPIGNGKDFRELIDLVSLQNLSWPTEYQDGRVIQCKPIQADDYKEIWDEIMIARSQLIDNIIDLDEKAFEKAYENETNDCLTSQDLYNALRRITLNRKGLPLLMGSSYHNKGVQPLMDSILRYLPHPKQISHDFIKYYEPELCALVFKNIHDKTHGPLAFVRVYSGKLKQDEKLYNVNNEAVEKAPVLLAPFANEFTPVSEVGEGNIAVIGGLKEVKTGDTLTTSSAVAQKAGKQYAKEHNTSDHKPVLAGIDIPKPVFFCTIEPPSPAYEKPLDKALMILQNEDPTLKVRYDESLGQSVIYGMGELHIDVIKKRILEEFKIEVYLGPLQVSYKEMVGSRAEHEYILNKVVGGSRNYVKIRLRVEPTEHQDEKLRVKVVVTKENNLGKLYQDRQKSVEEGVKAGLNSGPLLGFPVTGADVSLHWLEVGKGTSQAMLRAAAMACLKECLIQGGSTLLEPMMQLNITTPVQYASRVMSDLAQRRSQIGHIEAHGDQRVISAYTPLAELINYSSTLRTMTSGNVSLSMELHSYSPLDPNQTKKAIERVTGFAP
ncbi:GFM2 [Cordylochernes scorpioides]|uniref:GFM2 n=1 Tax=Cordylochernes scorpioides TaxID=51811 RepID=A0ABY6LEG1_9ARAC|nr:GFM2 [Cordylochernes scorpioides]